MMSMEDVSKDELLSTLVAVSLLLLAMAVEEEAEESSSVPRLTIHAIGSRILQSSYAVAVTASRIE